MPIFHWLICVENSLRIFGHYITLEAIVTKAAEAAGSQGHSVHATFGEEMGMAWEFDSLL